MKFFIKLLCFILSVFFIFIHSVFAKSLNTKTPSCVLFYYHHKPLPLDLLHTYDWIVLDPDNPFVEVLNDLFYQKKRAKILGYLSLGEIEPYRAYYKDLKRFSIGKNPMWDTYIADLRNKEYRDFLIHKVAKKIIEKGFDGFLFDTLDSYQLVIPKKKWKEFEKAQVEFIKTLKELYPDKLIVINRGFNILEEVKNYINGLVVESLFYGINEKKQYVPVPTEEREKLLKNLEKAKSLNIPTVIIDYVPKEDKELAQSLIVKISSLGFIPYIADKELSEIGVSLCNIVPRKVVLLYDSSIPIESSPYESSIHRLVSLPLEYLGFVPEIYDINKALPDISLENGYFGIITMFVNNKTETLYKWLLDKKKRGLKLFFIKDFPFDEKYLKDWGIILEKNFSKPLEPYKIILQKETSFEAPLKIEYQENLISSVKNGDPWVVLKNSYNQTHIPFAFTSWGGFAIGNSLINDEELWIVNPFEVFKALLNSSFPVPDVTTENGKRILTIHIDGDGFLGFSEFNPSKTTGEIIRDEILKVYKLPHTVSIIEGEVAPWGLKPEISERLETIAKSIFSLSNVEPASHSFSHPYKWEENDKTSYENNMPFYLPIPDYSFSYEKEIFGSIDYINKFLTPPDKKVKVFQWTGDCAPGEVPLKITYKARVYNINGGDTTITLSEPFLSRISPMGINFGPYFQVYAPFQNENKYTNLWQGPFWGYIKVIQSFELTENPLRLKPISIYYHFYSGQKLASLNALKKVYDFALSQKTNPMYVSEYIQKVLDLRETAILKTKDGFIIKNNGFLRTLRVPKSWGYPDIENGKGILGYSEKNDCFYVHLDGSGNYFLKFTQKKPKFRLVEANGQVEKWEYKDGVVFLELKAYVPLDLTIETSCKVFINDSLLKPDFKNEVLNIKRKEHYATIKALCNQ